jgi:hypothetical protein
MCSHSTQENAARLATWQGPGGRDTSQDSIMDENTNPTQCQRLLAYLERHGSITSLQAWMDLGIGRCAARIHELRKALRPQGKDIVTEEETILNRFNEPCTFAKYRLETVEA